MLDLHSHEIQPPISIKTQQNFLLLCEYINATQIAALAGVRSTVKLCFKELQLLIAQDSLRETAREAGVFELAASCFGARRGCGKKGRSTRRQASPIFGLVSKSFGC